MDQEDHHYERLSLRARRKKSSVSLSCCFNGRHPDSFDMVHSPANSVGRSPNSSAGLKGRYKSLISRMGRQRRHASADFSYDPLSYSLNFEDADDLHSYVVEDFPVPSFSSRLPLSPPQSSSSSGNRNQMTTTHHRHHHQLAGRAAAVAQVRRSLEGEKEEVESSPRHLLNPWMVQEMTRNNDGVEEVRSRLHIPAPRKVKTKMATPEPTSTRNINRELLTTTPSRAAGEVRGSYDYEEVTPVLVVSPTSRQVLVELC